MSSKIEVSREDAFYLAGDNCLARTLAVNKLRTLLAAPVVERQPGYVLAKQTVVEVPGQERKELGYTLFDGIGVFHSSDEVHAAIAELGLPLGWVSMTVDQLLPGYMMPIDAPPELAELRAELADTNVRLSNSIEQVDELQATIARLTTRSRS